MFLWSYRLARGAGHSVFGSLAAALLNWPLPDRSVKIQRQLDVHRHRLAKMLADQPDERYQQLRELLAQHEADRVHDGTERTSGKR